MKAFFITGTNTDCGKTYAACQLLDFYRRQGQRVVALKPVATGCHQEEGRLYSEDARLLQQHAGMDRENSLWCFEPPVSPHIAAAKAGVRIEAQSLVHYCQRESSDRPDVLLVEGAGGLMVPLNPEQTWIDFLQLSDISVIVVVGVRLGCINHALLTASVLTAHGISCAGWIANCLDPNLLYPDDTLQTLHDNMPMPYWGIIPFKGAFEAVGR